jgi:hypothetical protein
MTASAQADDERRRLEVERYVSARSVLRGADRRGC